MFPQYCGKFLSFFRFPTFPITISFFSCCSIGVIFHCKFVILNKLSYWIVVTQWKIHSFSCNSIFMILVRRSFHVCPHGFIGTNNKIIFFLCCPTVPQVSLCWWSRSHQGIAAGIGISNFLRAAFIVSLDSSSGSRKKIPRNLLALSELWLLDDPLWLCFFRCIRHMLPHIWPYIVRSWGCMFLRNLSHQTM